MTPLPRFRITFQFFQKNFKYGKRTPLLFKPRIYVKDLRVLFIQYGALFNALKRF